MRERRLFPADFEPMHGRMTLRRSLASLAPLLLLAACASGPGQEAASAAPPPMVQADAADQGALYGLYLQGQEAFNEGHRGEAASYFAEALKRQPGSDVLKSQAFIAALLSGDLGLAASLAPQAGEGSDAERSLGRLTGAVVAISEGRGANAETLLTSAPLAPEHATAAKVLLPWAAVEARDWKTALALPAGDGDHLVDEVALLNQALIFERRGRYAEAEANFRKLIGDGDGAGVNALAYGEFLERRGRKADAAKVYQAALNGGAPGQDLQAALNRIKAGGAAPAAPTPAQGAARALLPPSALLLADKQPELGQVYLRYVLNLDPTLDEGWLLIGDALAENGDVAGARAAYEKPKPGSADFVTARARLIATYDQADDTPTELQLAQETVKGAPDDPDAMSLLADALRLNGRYAESAQVLDQLIAREGEGAGWDLYYMRGVAYDQAGDWPKAEADLEKALSLSPSEPEVLNYLGYSWIDRGQKLDTARGMIEKAVAAKPDSGAIVDSLGWADYRLGHYQEAVEELERAAELEAADADINNHLGDAYWRVGRRIEARYQWEDVLTLHPSDKLRAEVEAKLRSGLTTESKTPAVAER